MFQRNLERVQVAHLELREKVATLGQIVWHCCFLKHYLKVCLLSSTTCYMCEHSFHQDSALRK